MKKKMAWALLEGALFFIGGVQFLHDVSILIKYKGSAGYLSNGGLFIILGLIMVYWRKDLFKKEWEQFFNS